MKLFFLVVLALTFVVVGCTSEKTPDGLVTLLGTEEFSDLISDDNVFVIDVHIPEQEHIKGTDELIPYNQIEENLDKLPSDKSAPIAIYCRSGSMSAEASQALFEMGYTKVYDLEGGAKAWRAAGLEFE